MPILTLVGLLILGLSPFVFENVFVGLAIGTVISSASGGLSEVLLSPIVAAIHCDNPDREMSNLHSAYAWGVVPVVIFTTLFIKIFGRSLWHAIPIIFCIVPICAFILFMSSKIPEIKTEEKTSGALSLLKNKQLVLCIIAIFLGGATECTISQWASGYIEMALGIPKYLGDIFGVMGFALLLGIGRTLYAKKGKNLEKVLFFSTIASFICYTLAVVSPFPVIGLIACMLTGISSAMLWPGMLVVSQKRVPNGGVFVYAMMATGGDLGAAVIPQIVGIVADASNITTGLSVSVIIPFLAIFVFGYILMSKKKFEL
jgi:fucose permease